MNSDKKGTVAANEIPSWVQQNIIRLNKEFGVHFVGSEEVALNLFMAIDSRRQTIENRGGVKSTQETETNEYLCDLWHKHQEGLLYRRFKVKLT